MKQPLIAAEHISAMPTPAAAITDGRRKATVVPSRSHSGPGQMIRAIASAVGDLFKAIGRRFFSSGATAPMAARPVGPQKSISEKYSAVRSNAILWAKLQAECKKSYTDDQLTTLEAGREFIGSSKDYGSFAKLMQVVAEQQPNIESRLMRELNAVRPENFDMQHATGLVANMNREMYLMLQGPANRAGASFD